MRVQASAQLVSGLTAKAKWGGSRGNDLSVAVKADGELFEITTTWRAKRWMPRWLLPLGLSRERLDHLGGLRQFGRGQRDPHRRHRWWEPGGRRL